jgi:hypothetical protein
MTISSATMPALLLACFMGATSVAAAQDVRTAAARSGHVKKQTRPAPQANTAPRGPSDADRWMDRASASGGGGGGGGGY